MRRSLSFVVAWAAAAGVATFVASQGVAVVGRQVTTERPPALSAAELDAAIDEAATTTTTTSTTSPGGDAAPTAAPSNPSPTPAPTTPVAGTSGGTTSPVVAGSPPTTTTTVTADDSASSTTTSPAPSTTAAAGETRTYNLVGGTAALRFSPSGVTVEYATPKPGFQVEVEPEHVNGVKVEFRSETHRSRVSGWWENGPVDDVREEVDD